MWLWLLGVRGWIKSNWKWLLPIILVIAAYFVISHVVSNIKEEAYKNGVTFERARYEEIIKKEDKKNREFEATLRGIVTEFGEKAVQEAIARSKKETVYQNRVETIIRDKPIYTDCKADQEVIDSRNIIRKLGPPKVSKREDGSVRVEFAS